MVYGENALQRNTLQGRVLQLFDTNGEKSNTIFETMEKRSFSNCTKFKFYVLFPNYVSVL